MSGIVTHEYILERWELKEGGFINYSEWERLARREHWDECFTVSHMIKYCNSVPYRRTEATEREDYTTLADALAEFKKKASSCTTGKWRLEVDGWRVVIKYYYSDGHVESDVIREHEWINENNPWWRKKNTNTLTNNENRVSELWYKDDAFNALYENYKKANPDDKKINKVRIERWTQKVNYFNFEINEELET